MPEERSKPTQVSLSTHGLLTSDEAAEYLGVSKRYLSRLVDMRKLAVSVMIGRSRMFRLTTLEAYKLTHPRLGRGRKVSA